MTNSESISEEGYGSRSRSRAKSVILSIGPLVSMKIPTSRKSRRSSSSEEGPELDPREMYVSFEQPPSSEGWFRTLLRQGHETHGTSRRPYHRGAPLLPYELPISKFYYNYRSANERKSQNGLNHVGGGGASSGGMATPTTISSGTLPSPGTNMNNTAPSGEESISDLHSLSLSLEGILAGDLGNSRRSLSDRMDDFVSGSVDSVLLDCLEDELPSVELADVLEVSEVLALTAVEETPPSTPVPPSVDNRRTTRASSGVPRVKRLSALKAAGGAFSYKEPDSDIEEEEDLALKVVVLTQKPKKAGPGRRRSEHNTSSQSESSTNSSAASINSGRGFRARMRRRKSRRRR
eukprot:TRINITY_DN6403_c0_g1_i1.p1 TRINITY_DN6403_c0_g1~~TRINITY_DN6403_c0_g1_i1.p1  ORF type:complete len:349 (-),score=80.79 TRINITY_DN6403_c0_g1_i1:81-1127(-)